jgi:hypothetical protein
VEGGGEGVEGEVDLLREGPMGFLQVQEEPEVFRSFREGGIPENAHGLIFLAGSEFSFPSE